MKFSIKDFFSKFDQNLQFPAGLVKFTEEILMENLIFCAGNSRILRDLECDIFRVPILCEHENIEGFSNLR